MYCTNNPVNYVDLSGYAPVKDTEGREICLSCMYEEGPIKDRIEEKEKEREKDTSLTGTAGAAAGAGVGSAADKIISENLPQNKLVQGGSKVTHALPNGGYYTTNIKWDYTKLAKGIKVGNVLGAAGIGIGTVYDIKVGGDRPLDAFVNNATVALATAGVIAGLTTFGLIAAPTLAVGIGVAVVVSLVFTGINYGTGWRPSDLF